MASTRESYICEYCGEGGELSNYSRHKKAKHPEHYVPRSERHRPGSASRNLTPTSGHSSGPSADNALARSWVSLLPTGSLRDIVMSAGWDTLDEIDSQDLSTWEQSTTTIPRILRTEDCWYPSAPTHKQVFKLMCRAIQTSTPEKRKYSVYDNDGSNGELGEALYQTHHEPNRANPTFIGTPDIQMENQFRFPPGRRLPALEPYRGLHFSLNPLYSFLDLRIDYGADSLGTIIGNSSRQWLMFPPTEQNLEVYTRFKDRSRPAGRFLLCAEELEGGVVASTGSGQTIHLPAGTIYASLTTKAGFLATQTFLSSESLVTMARHLVAELKTSNTLENGLTSSIEIYLTCLEQSFKACKTESIQRAVQSWLVSLGSLKGWMDVGEEYVQKIQDLKSRMDEIWKDPSNEAALDVAFSELECPCGEWLSNGDGQFRAHFALRHYF